MCIRERVKAFEKEKILSSFVNSFLVEAGRTERQEKEEILYVKLNQERKEKFRLLTKIVRENGEVRAEKEAMVPEAEWFLKTLEKLGAEKTGSDKYKNLPCKAENGKVSYPLLTGKTLHQEIAELAHEGKTGELKGLLKNFHRDFFQSRRIMAVSDTHLDVYKRQLQLRQAIPLLLRLQEIIQRILQ